MRMPKPPAGLAALTLAAVFLTAQTDTRPPDKPPLPEGSERMLRLDLLERPQEEMVPPRRNIFAPGARLDRPADLPIDQNPRLTAEDSGAATAVPEARLVGGPPLPTVNLRYIGYIESARRMIALVVIEGQAVAVVEEEVVGEGIRIGKITRDEIEIVLPDSSTRLFSLEGE